MKVIHPPYTTEVQFMFSALVIKGRTYKGTGELPGLGWWIEGTGMIRRLTSNDFPFLLGDT